MTKINQICLVLITLSLGAIATVQLGVVKPAHAISLNNAMRLIMEDIKASEERVIAKIDETCGGDG